MNATPRPSTEGLEGKMSRYDALAAPTLDERARQQFVSALRKHIMVDMSARMRRVYSEEVEPSFTEQNGRAPSSGLEVRKAMLPNAYFRAWSTLRYTAQEMTWSS